MNRINRLNYCRVGLQRFTLCKPVWLAGALSSGAGHPVGSAESTIYAFVIKRNNSYTK